jgi:hypothetical protein
MPRDADARVLEQFLRTMAPPATLTAVYRQRVVRSSLEAREKVLSRRRKQGLWLAVCCTAFALLIPCFCLTLTLKARPAMLAYEGRLTYVEPLLNSSRATVDRYESATIRAQFQVRLQTWMAAQRGGPTSVAD